jgi:hypothetical protein
MAFPRLLAVALALALLGAPAAAEIVTVTPQVDTYIEAGEEATWDHAACTYFDLDTKPWGVSYLMFPGIDDPRRVRSATLTLRCSNSSNDGGTIYPVSTFVPFFWLAGGCGPGGGSALRWDDVDCNGDGKITAADQACSALAPDFSRPIATFGSVKSGVSYTRDVTAAVQALPLGADFFTVAIANNSSDGATYRSKEYATEAYRPRLVLDLEDLPPRPSNDVCVPDPDLGGGPTVITSTPFSDIVDTRSATFDDGDPDLSCSGYRSGFRSVWYVYTPPTDGILAVTTRGSDYDTGVAVFTGVCDRTLTSTLHEVACDGDACDGPSGGQPARLSFPALGGVTYWIMVIDESGSAVGGSLHFALHFNECVY